jgi:hypothetical protein
MKRAIERTRSVAAMLHSKVTSTPVEAMERLSHATEPLPRQEHAPSKLALALAYPSPLHTALRGSSAAMPKTSPANHVVIPNRSGFDNAINHASSTRSRQ